jgi:ketosteroid isomerase-like protein
MRPFSTTLSPPSGRASRPTRYGRIPIVSTLLLAAATSNACSLPTDTGGSMQTQSNLEADRRAIEALNQHDVKAALASDIDAIVSQWTDDFVVLPPAGPIVRGRSANAAAAEQGKEQMQALIPVDYVVEFEEIIVTGDYACWRQRHDVQRQAHANPSTTARWHVEDASNDADKRTADALVWELRE